jgi:3-polyprenyl-4-hydroxybenzoate decarboxylase
MGKEKTYLVFVVECDGDTTCQRMNGNQIRELVNKFQYQEDIAIVEGNLIKGFDSKIDLTKL